MKLVFKVGVALVAGLVSFAACGDDDDGGGGGGAAGEGDFCQGAEDVAALDDRSTELFAGDTVDDEEAFAAAVEEIPDLLDEMNIALDMMIADSEGDTRRDLETVKEVSVGTLEAMRDADSPEDVAAAFSGAEFEEQATAAAEASLRIDEVTQDRCGVAFSD